MSLLGSLMGRIGRAPAQHQSADDLSGILAAGMDAFMRGDLVRASELSEQAQTLAPRAPDALYLAGVVSFARGDCDIAIAYLEQAIEEGGPRPAYLKDYGSFLASVGRHREGLAVLRRALGLQPDSVRIYSNLLFVMSCCDQLSPEEVYAAHRGFGETLADPLLAVGCVHANSRDPGRVLTVGYVSADFREHAMRYFIEPVLERHDHSNFRILCYNNGAITDDVSTRLREYADGWRDIGKLSDAELVALMRADAVDILVDLSGHTRGNRLMALAHKPAPVQATWFGTVQTTGMKAMDWRISDGHIDPEGKTEHLSRERLVRLAQSYACFRPHPDSPVVGPLPALHANSGQGVTFASFNAGHKINDAVVALWARLINGVAGSQLLMVVEHGDLPDIRRVVAARFEAQGLAPARLRVTGRKPVGQFLGMFNEVDVLLDPFPQNGGITSLHALWMGVPVISLAGAAPIGRIGVSLLRQLGLESFLAANADEYVQIARRCAQGLPELAALRAGLRARMRASTLMDEHAFIRELESAYRRMWREWCDAV